MKCVSAIPSCGAGNWAISSLLLALSAQDRKPAVKCLGKLGDCTPEYLWSDRMHSLNCFIPPFNPLVLPRDARVCASLHCAATPRAFADALQDSDASVHRYQP